MVPLLSPPRADQVTGVLAALETLAVKVWASLKFSCTQRGAQIWTPSSVVVSDPQPAKAKENRKEKITARCLKPMKTSQSLISSRNEGPDLIGESKQGGLVL